MQVYNLMVFILLVWLENFCSWHELHTQFCFFDSINKTTLYRP